MAFHTPGSLAGTLAAYERRKSSAGKSPQPYSQQIASGHEENMNHPEPAADTIYQRSLPSLHFLRWRPMYHLQAPNGWMNDPCAPNYDPSTGLYHLSFQWNARRNAHGKIAWGSIAWGHSMSKDLIHWSVSSATLVKPGAWYDREGCFTGCMQPMGVDGSNGNLTVFYTGVSRLPLHYTLPYINQTETLNIAQSTDGGSTWRKYKSNPILPEPPAGVSASGWRDPYVMPWESMDAVLGRPAGEQNLYGVISGGIKGQTPTAFLYAVNRTNLAEWVFLSSLVDIGLNHNISRWSGDMGINWECANFVTLTNKEDSVSREFIIVGGEGSNMMHPNSTFTEYPQELTKFPRAERSLQWMCGSLYAETSPSGGIVPKMKYRYGGRFDHGCMYGVNSFHDPLSSQQIAFGWITEEDLPQKLVDRQNWSGMMSIPRALGLVTLKGVTGALKSKLDEITSIESEQEPGSGSLNTYTIRTLGIYPAPSLSLLRRSTREVRLQGSLASGSASLDIQTHRFELLATFALSESCRRIGLTIFHDPSHDSAHTTQLYLTTATETLTIERPDPTPVDADIHTFPEKAPFTLFSFADGRREEFRLRAWFDESVLEVFANERCTFATRVYPTSKRCFGVRLWAEEEGAEGENGSRVVEARAWDGLRADIRVVS